MAREGSGNQTLYWKLQKKYFPHLTANPCTAIWGEKRRSNTWIRSLAGGETGSELRGNQRSHVAGARPLVLAASGREERDREDREATQLRRAAATGNGENFSDLAASSPCAVGSILHGGDCGWKDQGSMWNFQKEPLYLPLICTNPWNNRGIWGMAAACGLPEEEMAAARRRSICVYDVPEFTGRF